MIIMQSTSGGIVMEGFPTPLTHPLPGLIIGIFLDELAVPEDVGQMSGAVEVVDPS
jgi:hypothetical protein